MCEQKSSPEVCFVPSYLELPAEKEKKNQNKTQFRPYRLSIESLKNTIQVSRITLKILCLSYLPSFYIILNIIVSTYLEKEI